MATRCVVVTLLMAYLLLLNETSVAVIYTSKLIHRFSDEARSFWVSRNGNVSSWPKQSGVEFHRLLLSSDLNRQRMKLGSQYNTLVPSNGGQTFSYGNDLGWLHYTWIDIGTPNISFLVALDAGSDLLWVPCECIQCAPLSSSYYYMLDRDLSEYSPSVSSTSKHISCSHQLCESGPNCNSLKEPCPYSVNYYSENTSSSGFLFEDQFWLASVSEHAQRSSLQASVIIGCGRKQSGSYLDGAAPDGLMGLGFGDISVPSMLAKAGLIRNSFSICFDENNSGRIFFGDQGVGTQQSTPFLPSEGIHTTYIVEVKHCCFGSSCLKQTGFRAQVDSGTSFTYLPYELYGKIVMEFDKQLNATRTGLEGFPYCYEASSKELLHIPSMELMFVMNQSFIIKNPMFHFISDQGVNVSCLGIHPIDGEIGILGQNMMTGYRMVFDRENFKLGWSNSNCEDTSYHERVHLTPPPDDASPNPLPTNEQQSTSNARATAPAVAGRALSKPSAASPLLIPSWFCVVNLLLMLIFLYSDQPLWHDFQSIYV